MAEKKTSGERMRELHARYSAGLHNLQAEVEEGWKKVLDGCWAPADVEQLLHCVHRIAGSSSSYGYHQVHAAAAAVEAALNEILASPISATSDLQERLESRLDRLSAAFFSDKPRGEPQLSFMPVDETLRGARATQLIYLVEDDPLQADEIAEQVCYFGYAVTVFTDLSDLIAVVKQHPPRAILMDVIFPSGLTAGPELVMRLQTELHVSVPVIFFSESNSMISRLQAVRAGGQAYFTKPIDIGALVEVLDQLTIDETREPASVLIVDDKEEQAELTVKLLQNAGMQTCLVTNPLSILEALEKFQPNLILLAMSFEACSGQEISRVIRQLEKHVITPIIYLSDDEKREKTLEALITDSDDFIPRSIGAERLKKIVQARVDRFHHLRSLMDRDSLTGLYNHTMLKERLDQELSRASRLRSLVSFAMLDLDNFKLVNDTYGHAAGDRVLKGLARLLTQRLRRSDIIGRYGGEEFAIVLPDTPQSAALNLVNELRTAFEHIHHRGGGKDFTVTFSAGVASYPSFRSPIALIEAADAALYRAKHQGRNRVEQAGEASASENPLN